MPNNNITFNVHKPKNWKNYAVWFNHPLWNHPLPNPNHGHGLECIPIQNPFAKQLNKPFTDPNNPVVKPFFKPKI
jgi:hypothetical protein